jgi:hypothetical protein
MRRDRFLAAFAAFSMALAASAVEGQPANATDPNATPNAAEPNAVRIAAEPNVARNAAEPNAAPNTENAVPPAEAPSPAPAAASPDAFYASRRALGEQALAAGRAAEAADNLRVASFGLLDRPEKLSECLVSLAIAQQRAGRTADADATLRRFQSVQELFPSWGRLALAPDVRSEFVALARKRLPGLNLESPREAERRPPPVPPGAPAAEARPPSRPIAETPARTEAPPKTGAPSAAPPAPVPVALGPPPPPKPVRVLPEAPPAPKPAAVVAEVLPASGPAAAASERAPRGDPAAFEKPPAAEGRGTAASGTFPSGFVDREVRTGKAVVFEIQPDQARLFVDGRYVGIAGDWSDGTGRPFPLRAGEHDVRAVLPGYRELRLRLVADPSRSGDTVAAAELVRLERRSFRRIPRPDYVTAGRVAFAPELRGAEVAVDGEPTGAADRFTVSAPMRLNGPAVHDVVLSKPGRPARTIRVLASPMAGNDLVVVRTVL